MLSSPFDANGYCANVINVIQFVFLSVAQESMLYADRKGKVSKNKKTNKIIFMQHGFVQFIEWLFSLFPSFHTYVHGSSA